MTALIITLAIAALWGIALGYVIDSLIVAASDWRDQ